MEQELTEHQQEVLRLEQALAEQVAAEHFFETASGRLVVEILTKEITLLTRQITSDTFLKDHTGYVTAVSQLRAAQNLLKRLQAAAHPIRRNKIAERLELAKNG